MLLTKLQPTTAAELADQIIQKEPIFILDVRNEENYADWKIEGDSVTSINRPYFDLLDGVASVITELPQNQSILVVCAKEGSSIFVAEQLLEAGIQNVSYLSGGMAAWSEHLQPVKIGELSNGGSIHQFVRLGKGCLSYVIASNGEALIVDSARMTQPYLHFLAEHQLKLTHVVDTHLHADHISGGRVLAEQTGATYWLPQRDAEEVVFYYAPIQRNQELQIGQVNVKLFASPGHTIGSTSLIIDDQYLLSGDILFVESIGRPDLAGKAEDWVGDLRHTLYETYPALKEELVVLPAHYGHHHEQQADGSVQAVLGELYAVNEGLTIEDEQEFRHQVTFDLPPQPNAYQEIRQVNMGILKPDWQTQREMETGPNRCAVHGDH